MRLAARSVSGHLDPIDILCPPAGQCPNTAFGQAEAIDRKIAHFDLETLWASEHTQQPTEH